MSSVYFSPAVNLGLRNSTMREHAFVKTRSISGINIRKTHPNLYRAIMMLSLMGLAEGANFLFTHPTFTPLGIHRYVIAAAFIVIAVSQMWFLNVSRNLKMVRLSLAASISFMLFWGVTNSQQFFLGKSSLQLPILYLAVAVLQIPLLVEAPINPVTERKGHGETRRGGTA